MSKYDKYNLRELEKLKKEYESQQIREIHLLRCYGAKVKRVEPLSEEFEKTIAGIFETRKELERIGRELTIIRLAAISIENYMLDIRDE